MKQQLSAPASIPPQTPEDLLRNVVWLDGMGPQVIDFITSAAQLKVFGHGETISRQGDEVDGIYLVVTGMVKVRQRQADLGDHSTGLFYVLFPKGIQEFHHGFSETEVTEHELA